MTTLIRVFFVLLYNDLGLVNRKIQFLNQLAKTETKN